MPGIELSGKKTSCYHVKKEKNGGDEKREGREREREARAVTRERYNAKCVILSDERGEAAGIVRVCRLTQKQPKLLLVVQRRIASVKRKMKSETLW